MSEVDCPKCGAELTGHFDEHKPYYACGSIGYRAKGKIVAMNLQSPDCMTAERAKSAEREAERDARIEALEAEVDKLNSELADLYEYGQ